MTTDPGGDGTYIFTVQANGDAGIMLGNKSYISSITIEPAPETPVQTDYSITLSYNNSQGTVEASGTGTAGETQYIYVTPGDDYVVNIVTTNPSTTVSYNGIENGREVYSFTMPASDVTVNVTFSVKETPVETEYENAPIGNTGYATFSCDKALDFTGITSLTAYVINRIDNSYAYLEKVTGTVAANTGLLIVGSTTNIPVVENGTAYNDNMLKAVLRDQTISGPNKYVLTTDDGIHVKFAEVERQSATVEARHAYLNNSASGARVQYINIVWDENATAIDAAKAAFEGETIIYNLKGQRVVNPTKGVYIINGKKVAIK